MLISRDFMPLAADIRCLCQMDGACDDMDEQLAAERPEIPGAGESLRYAFSFLFVSHLLFCDLY